MQNLLLSLYPKVWREQYGEEYGALLEDTGLSGAIVLDIVKEGCLLRLKVYERGLNILAATSLYVLSGIMCIRFGLTDNWPIWAPTNPTRALGLIVTLTPLMYVLYVRFSLLWKRKRQWRGNTMVFWSVTSLLTVVSTIMLAFMCSFLFLSTGLFGISGGISFVCGALTMAGVSVGLVKLASLLQGRFLRRLAA